MPNGSRKIFAKKIKFVRFVRFFCVILIMKSVHKSKPDRFFYNLRVWLPGVKARQLIQAQTAAPWKWAAHKSQKTVSSP